MTMITVCLFLLSLLACPNMVSSRSALGNPKLGPTHKAHPNIQFFIRKVTVALANKVAAGPIEFRAVSYRKAILKTRPLLDLYFVKVKFRMNEHEYIHVRISRVRTAGAKNTHVILEGVHFHKTLNDVIKAFPSMYRIKNDIE